MSISRIRPDGAPIKTLSVQVTGTPAMAQVFDLGAISVVYLKMTLLSQNNDTVPLGVGVGEYSWQILDAVGFGTYPRQSRDGVTYTRLDTAQTGQATYYTGALPVVQAEAHGISSRYVMCVANFITSGPAVYSGPRSPTATWRIDVEYV